MQAYKQMQSAARETLQANPLRKLAISPHFPLAIFSPLMEMCEFGYMGVGNLALSTRVAKKSFKDMQILVQCRQVMHLFTVYSTAYSEVFILGSD